MPLSAPPIPVRLREMLEDYPAHIARLQAVLIAATEKQPSIAPRLERVIWALEEQLEAFHTEARVELGAARANGGEDAVASAEAKERLMSQLL